MASDIIEFVKTHFADLNAYRECYTTGRRPGVAYVKVDFSAQCQGGQEKDEAGELGVEGAERLR